MTAILQCDGGRGSLGAGVPPPGDRGHRVGVEGGSGVREADQTHRVRDVDGVFEGQDREVEVLAGMVVAGVGNDGRDGVSVRHLVRGVVLAHQQLHTGDGVPVRAVRRRQNVLARHERATAPRLIAARVHQCYLK